MENPISEQKLSDAETVIETLSDILGITEKEVIDIIEQGMIDEQCKILSNSPLKPKFKYLIDEMRATFNA